MKAILLLAAFLAAPPVHAHGEATHNRGAAAAAAEQTAWGIAGEPAKVGRTITFDTTDAMRFSPDSLTVRQGDTVRLVIRNGGSLGHEMVIGTRDALAEHAAMMARFPGMMHDEAYMVHVDPGESGEIVWHFNRAGSFEFACLIAGHFESGMRGTITVIPKKGGST